MPSEDSELSSAQYEDESSEIGGYGASPGQKNTCDVFTALQDFRTNMHAVKHACMHVCSTAGTMAELTKQTAPQHSSWL